MTAAPLPEGAGAPPLPPAPPDGAEPGIPLKGAAGGAYGDAAMELHATELMGRAKAGEAGAFDELVALMRARSFRLARSLVGSPEDALDLCQEAFLKVYRARASYREGEAFVPWFHRILRNTCFSHLRHHGRLKRVSLSGGPDEDDGEWTLESGDAPPSAALEADERAQAFWAAFHALKANDREILALRHFEELSYRAIARALEIPEGTVMSRLFHARRRLRDELAQRSSAAGELRGTTPSTR